MSNYYGGYGKGSDEIELLSPKTCGIVGSLLLIISLFLKFWNVDNLPIYGSIEVYLKDDIFNIMGVVLTIVFFMLSIWSESKIFMILTFLTMIYDFFGLFRRYNSIMDEISNLNSYSYSYYGPPVEFNFGIGLFTYIIGIVALLMGLYLAIRE